MISKFVIFDADGVLIDSLSQACHVFNEIASDKFPNLPHVSSQEDMAYVYPGPLRTSFRRFGLTDEETVAFFNRHSARMLKEAVSLEPFYNVISSIASTVAERCAIVSSSYRETIEQVLSKSPDFHPKMFTHILGREHHKTKTAKIESLLTDIGITQKDAVYVGDMVSDILYCREVPIRVASVGFGYQPANYLAAFCPDQLLPTIDSLNQFLRHNQTGAQVLQ